MKKTIGVLAHVDAGKTTFSEQLLYHTHSIRQRGRVDHKDAFLDNHDIEKERGITVFSEQGILSYKDSTYYLVDTPGHVDFSPEMERAIQIMDYAIIIVSAVEGVEGHTETVWQLLRKHKVPTFFFINKTDRVGANPERVIKEIRENLTQDICNITDTFSDNEMSQGFIEFIAERNENLLERYIEEDYDKDLWIRSAISMIKEGKIFLCSQGSALQDVGVVDFLDKLDILTSTGYSEKESFGGRVFKIRHDENGTRITYVKALSGILRVRDEVCYGDKENETCEKITQIRLYNGNKYSIVNQVGAGDVFAVIGLSKAAISEGLGTCDDRFTYEMAPTLKAKVVFHSSINPKDILRSFKILDAEDPSLNVVWEERLKEVHVHVMGVIQLEVLQQIVKDRFNYSISFGEPQILYKETIDSEAMGYGHFEPLKHYAEVHLKLEPGKRGSGIEFENRCHADDLTIGQQNLIRHHIFEKEHRGILTGSSITDIKVTLVTGRSHNKHTSGGDFREATLRALRQGLEKAKNILLEPFYGLKIKVDLDYMGRVLSDIQNAHGSFNAPQTIGDKVIITGKVPVATFIGYSTELAAFTQGKGVISLIFSGYEACHNQDEVIEDIGYNKDADPEYSSSSIFCSKGQGYVVPWYEAEENMHCSIQT